MDFRTNWERLFLEIADTGEQLFVTVLGKPYIELGRLPPRPEDLGTPTEHIPHIAVLAVYAENAPHRARREESYRNRARTSGRMR